MNREHLTTIETASRLGVTPQAITKWIRTGKFPNAQKINPAIKKSPYIIPVSDIEEFEKQNRSG